MSQRRYNDQCAHCLGSLGFGSATRHREILLPGVVAVRVIVCRKCAKQFDAATEPGQNYFKAVVLSNLIDAGILEGIDETTKSTSQIER